MINTINNPAISQCKGTTLKAQLKDIFSNMTNYGFYENMVLVGFKFYCKYFICQKSNLVKTGLLNKILLTIIIRMLYSNVFLFTFFTEIYV